MKPNFPIVKKGYDPDAVDAYIAELEKELKGFREREAAINSAIINSQIAADNIVKNANLESASNKIKTVELLDSVNKSLSTQKQLLSSFKSDYEILIKRYLIDLGEAEYNASNEKIDAVNEFVTKLKQEVANTKQAPASTTPNKAQDLVTEPKQAGQATAKVSDETKVYTTTSSETASAKEEPKTETSPKETAESPSPAEIAGIEDPASLRATSTRRKLNM